MLVVDVGCGPSLPYEKNGAFVIGLEPSYPSIRHNEDVDIRIMGSATKMPFPSHSLDMVVCFYSIHHFVGSNREENRRLVSDAFHEFARVIKPGGSLFIYEMIPMAPAALMQSFVWNPARKVLGKKLDMYFWNAEFFDRIRSGIRREVVLERVFFQSSLRMVICPAFSLPQLKLYRFLYPLAPKLFKFLF
jgi:ubiquinone/menaquinone biosynthesis C-methylase UbiE